MTDQPTRAKISQLHSLQSLRGVAAFLVVIFHAVAIQRTLLPADAVNELNLLSGFWDRGYVGVDLFFVISGFIMVYVTRNIGRSGRDVLRFVGARATRVYPLWWVFAGLMALYFYISYGVPADPFRIAQPGQVTPYLVKSFALVPQQHLPVLSVGWTLIHEIHFYIVFAVLLFLPKRFLSVSLLIWTVLVMALFFAGFSKPMANSWLSLISSVLSLEFIGGALIGLLISRGEVKFARIIALGGAIGLLLGMVLYKSDGTELVMWGRVAVFALPCFALVYGLTAMEIAGQIRPPIWLVKIGDWSYSLYLSHILVLSAVKRIHLKLNELLPEPVASIFKIGTPGPVDNIVAALVGIGACILFAGFAHRFIEKPLITGSRLLLKR